MKQMEVIAKIILKNKTDIPTVVELFNKQNGCEIKTRDMEGFVNNVPIQCMVYTKEILSPIVNDYTQSYFDFMESLMEQGIIINNFKSSNNSQIEMYMKDLIKGRVKYDFEGAVALMGRTPMKIKMLPNSEFEIDFNITSKQSQIKEFQNV